MREPGPAQASDFAFNVYACGAAGDGVTLDTGALQKALDLCSERGGRVVLPPGEFLTGTLYLKSHTCLHLMAGAVLRGSPDLTQYATDTHHNRYDHEPGLNPCLLYAQDAEDITLEGPGVLHGSGEAFYDPTTEAVPHPMLLRLLRCRDVRLHGVKVRMPAGWSTAFIECEGVTASDLDIVSRHSNGDGLDFDSCHDVVVTGCRFDTSDDAICLQSSVPGRSCRNVVITNCLMKSKWAAVRIGLMSVGGIEDVCLSNCVFHDIRCSGLKIQATEGGYLRNMRFENIVMHNVTRPLFITSNYFPITKDVPLVFRESPGIDNLSFSHITVTYSEDFAFDPAAGIILMGTPERPIHRLKLTDISLQAPGGYQGQAPSTVPELTGKRPEYYAFKEIPAWGLYARHLVSPEFQDIALTLMRPDTRQEHWLEEISAV